MKPASAPKTPESGAKPLPHLQGALVSLQITGSQAAKIGLLDRWVVARKKTLSRQRNKFTVTDRLKRVTDQILDCAEVEHLSKRQFEKKADLSWRTLHRCRDGKADARTWLPKLEAALAKLKHS